MYVCLCHAVTEDDIRFAVREGLSSLQDLQQCFGVATGCGQCTEHAIAILEETRAETVAFGPAPSKPCSFRPSEFLFQIQL